MTTLLPKDADNNPIPALRLKDGGAHSVAIVSAATSNATASDSNTKVVSLYATTACYIKFGDAGVTATTTDHYYPADVYYDIALGGGGNKGPHHTHISVLRIVDDGTLFISEKE